LKYQRITEEEQRRIAEETGHPRPQDTPDLPEEHALAREWKTYKREAGRLLAEGHTGQFVLIKGDAVLGVWDSSADASRVGRERFGLEAFMVHEVQPVERPIRIGYLMRCRS
jgi:hypothetical protein